MKKNYFKRNIFVLMILCITTLLFGCEQETVKTSVESFDKDTKLSVLFHSEQMGEFSRFLMYRSDSYAKRLEKKTLNDLQEENSAWNADSMEYGINHMLDTINAGVKVNYDFWSDEDQSTDTDKKNTQLFYLPGKEDAPFVLLCAGGGFTAVCNIQESFPVAAKLNELGYNVFVLSYRIQPAAKSVDFEAATDVAIEDVAEALNYITANADSFKISTENYAIGGFSAGSILVSEWCIKEKGWGKYEMQEPECAFLAYGFTSDVEYITDEYPPTYMVYCMDDTTIPVSSMTDMSDALNEHNVLLEKNIGQHGGHGFGLGLDTDVDGWVEQAVEFWQNLN